MTKEVLLTLKSVQFDGEETQEYSSSYPAEYYVRSGKRYIVYDEQDEDSGQVTKNIIKFTEREVEVIKKGVVNSTMLFTQGIKKVTDYRTPYGELLMGTDTKAIRFFETDERIRVDIEYDLEINNEHQAQCRISLTLIAERNYSTKSVKLSNTIYE